MLTRAAKEVLKKSPNDVVVLSSLRSPVSRAYKGGFKDAYPEEILMPVRERAYPAVIEKLTRLTNTGHASRRQESQRQPRRCQRRHDRKRALRTGFRENRSHGPQRCRLPQLHHLPYRQPSVL